MNTDKEHKRDKKDLRQAIRVRQSDEAYRISATVKAAAVILRPLHQASYEHISSETLARLVEGLQAAANSGTYDGGTYADDYQTAIAKVGQRQGIDVKEIPPEVHDRIRKLV